MRRKHPADDLDQDIRDPEIVGRRIEDAIQRVGHVCAEKEHYFRQVLVVDFEPATG